MTIPAKHLPKRQTRSRRAHDFLTPTALTKCTNCGAPVRPHYACASCGQYRGRTAVVKKVKRAARPKA